MFVSKNSNPRVRAMTPWLRALDALEEDLGLVFSTHSQGLVIPVPDSNTLFFLLPAFMHTHTYTHTHFKRKKTKEIEAEPTAPWKRVRPVGD